MSIVTSVPVEIVNPDIPYDKLGIYMSISPVWGEKSIGGVASLRVVPFRVLPDGTIDKREDKARDLVIDNVFEEYAKDPVFAETMNQIWKGLQEYITHKQL